jgi:nitroreductase
MLKQLVKKNRSYRRFDGTVRITKTQINKMLELARLCPSAANLQQLRFFYSITGKTNDIIYSHLSWAAYLKDWHGPKHGETPTGYILILGPSKVSKHLLIDVGIVAQTILLGATELDLGGCQIASVNKTELHKALSLPKDLEILLALAIGKPVEQVVIEKVIDPDDIEYWRDEFEVHHVPKRALKDLIVNKKEL